MFYVKIKAWRKGLVFKNGKYTRVLNEGIHLLGINEKVMIYEMDRPFAPPVYLNILLQDDELANMLQIVEVMDNEIALKYVDGLF